MFAPDGYFPFDVAKPWFIERADSFMYECALPWVDEVEKQDVGKTSDELWRFAYASRMVFHEWLIDTCLAWQPSQVFLASPDGRVVRASGTFFCSEEQLSWYDFVWPLNDDELRPIAESRDAESILKGRFGYYFFNIATSCIQLPSEDELCKMPLKAREIYPIVKHFEGWSVCFRNGDEDSLEKKLVMMFDWTKGEKKEKQRGRPRKQEKAARFYRSLYPNGHENMGLTWSQAAENVGRALNTQLSIDTLKRGLAEN